MQKLLVKLATLICLIFISEGIFALLSGPTSEDLLDLGVVSDPARPLWYHLYFYTFCVLSAALCLLERKSIIFLLQKNKEACLLFGYLLLSCAWSLDPGKSFYILVKFIWAFCFGLFLVSRFSSREILSLLWAWAAIIILADWFFVLMIPHYGMHGDGSWRGAYGDRNESAMASNIALLTLMVGFASGTRKIQWISVGLAILAACLIVMSGSATGFVTLCALCAFYLCLRFFKAYWHLSLVFLLTSLCFIIVVMLTASFTPDIGQFFILLGKDETASGRLNIWSGFINAMQGHMLGGYGAQDLFVTTRGQILTEHYVSPDGDFQAMAPHNLYIAIMLKYGLAGTALFAWMAWKALSRGFRELMGTTSMRYWYILLMMIVGVYGFTLTIDNKMFVWTLFALVLGSPYIRSGDPQPVTGAA